MTTTEPDTTADEADDLDGCDIGDSIVPDDDETAEMRALFPDGNPATLDQWNELFNGS